MTISRANAKYPEEQLRGARGVEGWLALDRLGRYADVIPRLRIGRGELPALNYRPAWLYWSGPRVRTSRENRVLAHDRYLLYGWSTT